MEQKQISARLRDVERLIRTYIAAKVKKPDAIKNMTQLQIIFFLLNHMDEEINQKDIGVSLGLKKSSITEHLDYLESKEIVQRISDPTDKRRKQIVLSDRALKFNSDLNEVVNDINDKIIEDIPQDKLDTFLEVLDIIEANIRNELD